MTGGKLCMYNNTDNNNTYLNNTYIKYTISTTIVVVRNKGFGISRSI